MAGDSVLSNVSYNPNTGAGRVNALPLVNGFNSSSFGNRGHLNRMLKTNMDLITPTNNVLPASNLGQILLPGSIMNWFQPAMTKNDNIAVGAIGGTLSWTGMATIPLNKLHDFFDKLPTVGSSQGF